MKVAIKVDLRPMRSPKWPKIASADRARDEADGVNAERVQGGNQRIFVREVEGSKDKASGGAVEEEIIPLDRCADRGSHCSPGEHSAVFGRRQSRGMGTR